MLAGKIIGIGLVGLLQLAIIAAVALVLVSVTNVVSIPTFTLAAILGYLMWFTLGFLLYATAYAAVASTVSRSEEVQGATAPIQVFLIVGYVAVYASIGNLSGPLATVLSLLPPFAPTLMSVRMAGSDVPAWQVGLAVGLILVSIGGLILACRPDLQQFGAAPSGLRCASGTRSGEIGGHVRVLLIRRVREFENAATTVDPRPRRRAVHRGRLLVGHRWPVAGRRGTVCSW